MCIICLKVRKYIQYNIIYEKKVKALFRILTNGKKEQANIPITNVKHTHIFIHTKNMCMQYTTILT